MTLQTKYDERTVVWVLNPKSGAAVLRSIVGIRTQSIFGDKKTIYGFLKDWSVNKSNPEIDDLFWLSEDKVHESKERLIASL